MYTNWAEVQRKKLVRLMNDLVIKLLEYNMCETVSLLERFQLS